MEEVFIRMEVDNLVSSLRMFDTHPKYYTLIELVENIQKSLLTLEKRKALEKGIKIYFN